MKQVPYLLFYALIHPQRLAGVGKICNNRRLPENWVNLRI